MNKDTLKTYEEIITHNKDYNDFSAWFEEYCEGHVREEEVEEQIIARRLDYYTAFFCIHHQNQIRSEVEAQIKNYYDKGEHESTHLR
jgi:hypothetical protein